MDISLKMLQFLSVFNMTYNQKLSIEPFDRGRKLHGVYANIPDQLDLRHTGFVGPVHNQGKCNACWAFTAAGSKEYHVGKEVSVQNILDCSPDTYGCSGGLMGHVFEYYDHFPLKYEYHYKKGKCMPHHTGAHVKNYIAMDVDIENSLPFMLQQWGPVAVGVDFKQLQKYRGSVIKPGDCRKDPHHAVLVVGYTRDYWIVKNSLGTNWGDSGYAYLSRGHNTCGIDSTYATVATEVQLKF